MSAPSEPSAAGTNRSMPDSMVIPELAYPDVRAAVDWLTRAFGLVERLRIGNHRAQLTYGAGAIVVTQQQGAVANEAARDHGLLVRVPDVHAHYARARKAGALIVNPPTDHPYGERQYTAADLAGHRWTFSQTIADSDPAAWGGVLLE